MSTSTKLNIIASDDNASRDNIVNGYKERLLVRFLTDTAEHISMLPTKIEESSDKVGLSIEGRSFIKNNWYSLKGYYNPTKKTGWLEVVEDTALSIGMIFTTSNGSYTTSG